MEKTVTSDTPIYQTFEQNPILFGKFYFPHHLRDRSPYFHWILISDNADTGFNAYQAPRGSAKSTIVVFLKRIHRICFKKKRFIVIVQNTYKKAVGTLEGIKDEFRYNERLKEDFGISLEKDSEGDTIFRHRDGFRIRVLCKGVEQIGSIRGEKFGAYRPDDIVGDDMEDDEMVKSTERRQSLKDLYDNALIPAGDIKNLSVDIVGTLLHDDSLMSDLVSRDKYTHYRKLFFKARFKNKVTGLDDSLWPERWSVADLNEFEQQKPDTFAKEMQGDPSSGSLETIRREDFRYWRIEEGQAVLYGQDSEVVSRYSIKDCAWGVGIDMAWEDKKASDYSAIVPGLLTPGNDLLINDYVVKRGLRPDEFENIIFDMNETYERLTGKRGAFGFEKAKLEKVMKWFLREAMKRRSKYLWFKDIAWGTQDKIERIMFRLGNRYAQHGVYHKKGMGDLENQLIRLRSAAHDDLCFIGETLILTDKGNIPIKDIKIGDYVLTRNGYRKVIGSKCTGIENVIENINLIGTKNHPIFTKHGIKRLEDCHVYDILYIWNEKLLSIEEKSITDIQIQKDVSTEFISGGMINGKKRLSLFIDKYISIILGQFQLVMLFIIKMRTRLTTILPISNAYPSLITCGYTLLNREEYQIQRKCSQMERECIQKNQNKKQGNGTRVQKVKNGIRRMGLRFPQKVYNLKIEIDNEYFANNILVHNCDAEAMLPEILAYAPIKTPDKKPQDMFKFLQQQTSSWRGSHKEKYIFGVRQRPSVITTKQGM